MGLLRHRSHTPPRCRLQTLLTFLLFASAAAITLSQLGCEARQLEEREQREAGGGGGTIFQQQVGVSRRRLGGLGSSPPTCRSKCGRCSPCKAVHVPIHPGVSTPLEYYPEAWRCQCGNKLFMP